MLLANKFMTGALPQLSTKNYDEVARLKQKVDPEKALLFYLLIVPPYSTIPCMFSEATVSICSLPTKKKSQEPEVVWVKIAVSNILFLFEVNIMNTIVSFTHGR